MTLEKTLPDCEFRALIEDSTLYVCQHNRVRASNGIVSADVCLSCSVRTLTTIPSEVHDRQVAQRQSIPNIARRAWSLANSVSDFIADGCRTLTPSEFEARLAICDACEFRKGNSCTKCGCKLSLKARGRAFSCPIGKWPEIKTKREKKAK